MSTVENCLENERKFIEINKNISVYKIKMKEFMTPASQHLIYAQHPNVYLICN